MDNLPTDPRTDPISKDFEENLHKLDDARGWKLSEVWRQVMAFHDENRLLRKNMMQMQVVLQDHYHQWMDVRKRVGKILEIVDKGIDTGKATPEEVDTYMARLKQAMDLNDQATKMVGQVSNVIRDYKKEIRMTEFQSKFYYHVGMVQQFMSGLTALLFKHLQSTDKLDSILKDMRRLAQMMAITTESKEVDDE